MIDTLARFRPVASPADTLYAGDYAVGRYLSSLCLDRQAAILLIHHTRKMASEDPIDMISGTLGLAGGVDGFMVLTREPLADAATLYVSGRDIEEAGKHAVAWDRDRARWRLTGGGPTACASGARATARGRCVARGSEEHSGACRGVEPWPSASYLVRTATPSTRPFLRSSTNSGVRGLSSNGPLTVGGGCSLYPLLLLEQKEGIDVGELLELLELLEPLEPQRTFPVVPVVHAPAVPVRAATGAAA